MPDNDATPDAPPERRPPRWTTGQGIGFLAMLPGLLFLLAAFAAYATSTNLRGDEQEAAEIAAAATGALGLLLALPGVIVFAMCRTRKPL